MSSPVRAPFQGRGRDLARAFSGGHYFHRAARHHHRHHVGFRELGGDDKVAGNKRCG